MTIYRSGVFNRREGAPTEGTRTRWLETNSKTEKSGAMLRPVGVYRVEEIRIV